MDIYIVETNVNHPSKHRGYIGSFFNRTFTRRHSALQPPIKVFDNLNDVQEFLMQLEYSKCCNYTVNRINNVNEEYLNSYSGNYYRDIIPAKNPDEKAVALPPYREIDRTLFKQLLQQDTEIPIRRSTV